ncbi:MAG TPA: hypothetical protein VFG31_02045 [Conexibacter sp.]|nr:hypothetical protein [Conexibacter sp.]
MRKLDRAMRPGPAGGTTVGEVDAKCMRRLRADNSIGCEPMVGLEAADGLAGLRTEDAVGGNAKLLLKLGDKRAATAALERRDADAGSGHMAAGGGPRPASFGTGRRGNCACQREREHERGNDGETN